MLPNVGPAELIIILAIALLIVGPKRLPEMGSAVGRSIREFRKATSDVTDETTAPAGGASGASTATAPDPAATSGTATEAADDEGSDTIGERV